LPQNFLLIDATLIARLKRLKEFASKPENHYKVGESDWIPGFTPGYKVRADTYSIVFTHSLDHNKKLFRHLSVRVLGDGKLPTQDAVFTIAHHLGFKGVMEKPGRPGIYENKPPPFGNLYIAQNEDEETIVIGEEIKDV
jgi:hypothetical protein